MANAVEQFAYLLSQTLKVLRDEAIVRSKREERGVARSSTHIETRLGNATYDVIQCRARAPKRRRSQNAIEDRGERKA